MNHFRQNSFFDAETRYGMDMDIEIAKMKLKEAKKPPAEITTKQLEDWLHRLKGAADEAGDARLLALESDLLDLRDEINGQTCCAI